ncbi:MAG: S1 RNA-binding domain-containing protein [Candidatus Promineifilaceae bacterium]|nr:S1 RNA-binding domain-containing protein [Candidatus Promineifilaceae bacterium]
MSFLLSENEMELGFPQSGEIRQGEVVASRDREVLVDIGAKSEGIISGRELESMDKPTRQQLEVGNSVSVYVINPEDADGNLVLSYVKALEQEDWSQAREMMDNEDVFEGSIIGFNRGGVLVNVGRLRGFIPASQLSLERRGRQGSHEERLRGLVGEAVTARVLEVDQERNRLILSERAAMKEIRAAQRTRLMNELEEGDDRSGRVVNLADFGAFVDIGGIEGLVHVSELSWKRVSHPSEVLQVGDKIDVRVINIDEQRGRVGLSLKRMQPDPWTLIEQIYNEGELVEAEITKLTKYGAFARIQDDYELEGLIHISEMSEDHVEHPQDIVRPGEIVAARIIRVDSEQRQIGLSMKQVASVEYLEADLALVEETEQD